MTTKEEIISRIEKLLRLADTSKNNNVHQVSEALKKAHELMKRHNIDLSKLNVDNKANVHVEMRVVDLPSTYGYVKLLAGAAAKLFNVFTYQVRHGVGDHRMHFVGDPTDLALTIEVFNWLQYKAKKSAKDNIGGQFGKDQRAFCDGFAVAIHDSVEKTTKTDLTQITDDDRRYALVVTDKSTAVTSFLKERKINLVRTKARKVKMNYNYFNIGHTEGKKVNLTGFRKSIGG